MDKTKPTMFAVKNTKTGKLVGEIDVGVGTIPDIRDAEEYPSLVNTFPDAVAAEKWAELHSDAGYGLTDYEVVEFG